MLILQQLKLFQEESFY